MSSYTAAERRAYRAGKKAKAPRRKAYVAAQSRPYRTQVRGQGDYRLKKNFFSAPKLGSNLGGFAGSALGGFIAPGIGSTIGGTLGSNIGREAGRIFKSVTGWGDYTVNQNSLVYPDQEVPVFGDDSIRVRHKEYICDIAASHDFASTEFPINPGLDSTFPWLTAIARNYEQYRFNGLIFQFVSTSSDAIADTTDLGLGTICLSTDYNAADPAYVNMPQALNSMFANSAKPSMNIYHAIECAPSEQASKLYYVRTGDPAQNTDIRLYDLGKFQVSTQGMPASATYDCGQLWVTYDITFCKSVMNNQLGYALNTDKYVLDGIEGTDTLGDGGSPIQYSSIGTFIDHAPGQSPTDTIYFPVELASGFYLINYASYHSSAALGTVNPSVHHNCELVYCWVSNSDTDVTSSGTTGTAMISITLIKITGRGAYISLVGSSLPSSTTGDLLITQVNGELFGGFNTASG